MIRSTIPRSPVNVFHQGEHLENEGAKPWFLASAFVF